MTTNALQAPVLLLVEDNPGDALLVRELLREPGDDRYEIVHVATLTDALTQLKTAAVEIVVLDLKLADCMGVEAVKLVRQTAKATPIVVLTGADDEQLALACIDAGAQDYLTKSEVRTRTLRRAIGYAVTRLREAQLRELQDALERYRALSSTTQNTTVTAALAGSGSVRVRRPDAFATLVSDYFALFDPFLTRQADRVEADRVDMELIVTSLGDVGGGPRDLLDMHVAALDRALAQDDPHSRSIVYEARLLALEMMGLLVDYYRVGYRRRFRKGTP